MKTMAVPILRKMNDTDTYKHSTSLQRAHYQSHFNATIIGIFYTILT